jgi:hypothetical protein
MEGKLIKTDGTYILSVNEYKDEVFAIADNNKAHELNKNKLSLKNCEAIANGYDLDELVREACDITDPLRLDSQKYKQDPYFKIGFNKGFQKALEILGDKKFSEEDMKKAMNKIVTATYSNKGDDIFDLFIEIHRKKYMDEYIQSLQQSEWDVEIVMICPHPEDTYVCGIQYGCDGDGCNHPNQIPYLDSDSCLILKRK